jgi:hypothetical protein
VLIPARLLGIMPSIASSWDVMKFSFLVDWIANVGDKAHVLDNHVFALFCRISGSVSTISVDIPIHSHLVSNSGCSMILDEPRVRLFSRIVEDTIPPIYPSSVDLLPAEKISNMKISIGLCLAWQNLSGD